MTPPAVTRNGFRRPQYRPWPGRIRLAAGLAAGALLAACNQPSGPRASQPVAFQLAAQTTRAPRTTGASADAATSLELSSFRLVVGAAALGQGDQYGCVDCQDADGAEAASPQQVLDVPLGGGTVLVSTEAVTAGSYSSAEISVESPGPGLATGASWPAGATIVIGGRVNGTAFQLPLHIEGGFRQPLAPPVQVSAAGSPAAIPVTITLPVAAWFTANGSTLDPSIPAQRAQIEANARAAFAAPEAKDGGGREG